MQKIIRGETLGDKVYDVMKQLILEMKPGANRLPSEDELARNLGVSRTTVRDSMHALILQGAITKVKGKGTFGHPEVFRADNRVDLYPDFYRLLTQQYRNVELKTHIQGKIPPGEKFLRYFKTHSPSEKVFAMEWIYSADGGAKIYGRFEFPITVFRELPSPTDIILNLPAFGARYLYRDIAYCVMHLKCGLNDDAAALFGIGHDVPMQCWEEVVYDIEDRAVGFCKFYLHPDDMVMSIITKFNG
jgi:GntR family transcriptional regulator